MRGTEAEKQNQLTRLRDFHTAHAADAPAMLARLQDTVRQDGNVFAVLMDAVKVKENIHLVQLLADSKYEVGVDFLIGLAGSSVGPEGVPEL